MGTIATSFDKIAWKAGNAISDFAQQASSVFGSIVGDAKAAVQGLYNGDVIGIREDGVDEMKTSVTNYIEGLQTTLDEFAKTIETDEAFKGTELTAVVKQFISAIKDICNSLIGDLEGFNTELDKIAAQYKTNINSTLAQSISSQAEELKNAYTPSDSSTQ